MFQDYLRGFWRGVLHNKVATFINVGGLAIGLAVFFALTFYVDREFSWDTHWEDADRIFVASGVMESAGGGAPGMMNVGPWVLGTSLQMRHPDAFETYARIYQTQGLVTVDGIEYPFQARYSAEPALRDLLQIETLEGSLDAVFADPRAVAISEQAAERMFGEASPLGQVVTFSAQQGFGGSTIPADFVIEAVFRLPQPTIFTMPFLTLLTPEALPAQNARLDLWQFLPPSQPPRAGEAPPASEFPFNVTHYFKLREGVDAKALEADLRSFMDENRHMDNGGSKTRYVFRNIQELHLSPSPFEAGDNRQRLHVLAAVGVLVLLISGCNFVMLATLRLVDRMREVGIRKSVGGGTNQLMWQYLFDAFLQTLLAAVLAVAFLALAFPKLSVMLELPLQLDLLTPRNISLCLAMVVLFTLASSFYPAWMSAQSKPGPLLRNGVGAVVGTGTGLRKLLVSLQFAIVVVLLLASAVVQQQIEFTRGRDPGYNLDDVVTVRMSEPSAFPRIPAILDELSKVSGVDVAAAGGVGPGAIMFQTPTRVRLLAIDGTQHEAALEPSNVGPGYFRMMSTPILAGREFSLDDVPAPATANAPSTTVNPAAPLPERKVILNAAATRQLGFATPALAVDQLLESESTMPDGKASKQSMRVIGVVADTQLVSIMLPPPAVLYGVSRNSNFLGAKLLPGADRDEVTAGMRAAWDSVVPGVEFSPLDVATMTGFQLRREEFEARIITYSTGLAIIIALLGLYGLVAATVVKRVKEIGVRKVMGAERSSIVTLFLLQFSKPIVVANLIAWPFGFWAIKQWLTRFPYQLDTLVIVISGLSASIAALLIAWLTVGAMAARAASVNPVRTLRYE